LVKELRSYNSCLPISLLTAFIIRHKVKHQNVHDKNMAVPFHAAVLSCYKAQENMNSSCTGMLANTLACTAADYWAAERGNYISIISDYKQTLDGLSALTKFIPLNEESSCAILL
jgi:hypothetical protein